jgi:succinoglycan biosynthesis transport protein ExoP
MSQMQSEWTSADNPESAEFGGIPDALRDPAGLIRRRWPWMLVTLLAGLVATLLFFVLKEPRYLAQATVLVTAQQISKDLVRSTIAGDPLESINAMVNEILSQDSLVGIIEEHGLYSELRDSQTLGQIAIQARNDVHVEMERGSGRRSGRDGTQLLKIGFESEDPEVAATVANALAGLFTNVSIQRRSEQIRMTTEFLRRELENAEKELREQGSEITEFKERYRGELPADLQANLAKLERLQQQRQSLALQIAEAETRLAMLSGVEGAPPETRLAALRNQLEEKLVTKTESHPDVRLLRNQIKALVTQIEEAQAGGWASGGAGPGGSAAPPGTLEELRAQLASTERMIRDYDARVARTPARQEELTALQEREGVLRESYLEFLRKVNDAELTQAMELAQQGDRFSVSDPAQIPVKPMRARWKVLVAGLVASFGLSLGVGVLLETLDPVLLTAGQLESASGLNVLGSVPRLS